jgi:hypothetical protein
VVPIANPAQRPKRSRVLSWVGLGSVVALLAAVPFLPMPAFTAESSSPSPVLQSEQAPTSGAATSGTPTTTTVSTVGTNSLTDPAQPTNTTLPAGAAPAAASNASDSRPTTTIPYWMQQRPPETDGVGQLESSPLPPSSGYGGLNDQGEPKTQAVGGYYRQDGTYVKPYYRAPGH